MKFNFLHVFLLLSFVLQLVLVTSNNAGVTPEIYWNSVLPSSPMPKALKNILYTKGLVEEKTTPEHVDKQDEYSNTGARKGTDVSVGKGSVVVATGYKDKKYLYVKVNPGMTRSPFQYSYAATVEQLVDKSVVTLFFLENDLHQGAEMNLVFNRSTTPKAKLLSLQVADSIPFSSDKLPKIYEEFSLDPNSMEANVTEATVRICEAQGIEGEEKYCATSLESMIDFSTSKLGNKVMAVSTDANTKETTSLQTYIIEGAKKLASDNNTVVCHKQNYPYAVFYCHKTLNSRAYVVSLVGDMDGTKVKAVSICHSDTSKWNLKHLAFQVLKVNPGSVPVCHFLPEEHVVWVPY